VKGLNKEGEVAKMRTFTVLLTADLDRAVRNLARMKRISAGAVVRMLLSERLTEIGLLELEPQPSSSGPVGPGVVAVKGAGRAGPETGGDAPQPVEKNQEKGGGRG
jgi:hypothetical protein